MRLPAVLNGDKVASQYWKRHAASLEKSGILTDRDTETFCLLCRVYSLLVSVDTLSDTKGIIKFVGLLKQYNSLAAKFGLNPADRKKQGFVSDETETDEFGL